MQLTPFVFALAAFFAFSVQSSEQPQSDTNRPPVAPVKPVVDDYYGTKITDPYRYMENFKDPQVQSWVKAQADYAHVTLSDIPGREKLFERIRELDQSVPQVSARRFPGDLYLISKRLPGEDLNKLYVRHGLNGQDTLLVDPEKVNVAADARGKGRNSIQYYEVSDDAKYVAVGIAPGGSERDTELHVFEIASAREFDHHIAHVWFGMNWLPDSRSFVYLRMQKLPPGAPTTEIEQKQRTYLHVFGTDPDKDRAVFGYGAVPSIKVDPSYFGGIAITPGSPYALGSINTGVSPNSAFYIKPVASLGKRNSDWRKIADFSDNANNVVVHGEDLHVLSFNDAFRYKVLRTSAKSPDLSTAEVVVPASEAVITGINDASDALYIDLLDGGIGRVLRVPYRSPAKVEEVPLPLKGNSSTTTHPLVPGALISLVSWTKASQIYQFDPTSKSLTNTNLKPVGPHDTPSDLESVEVKVPSYDGTQVPLSIVYKKGLQLDGSNPTLMMGYGAYGITMDPNFSPIRLAWYEKGGVYAVCHVRGGGEYGEEWHLAGKGPTKPNTWRDFIACGEYLINQKYTSSARLAGEGGSAGGILIGRSITERPDLFAAAIDVVGISDSLRVETTANGVPNIPEFGSTKTLAGYKELYEMSSYAHIQDKTPYPAVLLETGINDPRVEPWQVAKMAARLQSATTSSKPILFRVEYAGGHGGIGGTRKQAEEENADAFSFLLWQFGVPGFQPHRSN